MQHYRTDLQPQDTCERYLQHQQDLYHVFIDFMKAFHMVWHAALWPTMRLYNIIVNLINVIKNLNDKATSAVSFNGRTGEGFRTTVGIRQHCLLSPTPFKISLNHEGTITTQRFADDIRPSRHGTRVS